MLLRTPDLLVTLGFCQWYITSNSIPTGFSVNSYGVKLISQRLKQKVTEKSEGKRVRVPGLGEFIVVDDSEASDAGSPRFEAKTGAEAPVAASSVVGTAPVEHADVEGVEEEDPDVHFKRKREGGSRRKRVVKKPHYYTPTIVAEGELPTAAPPFAPLVTELSVPKLTTGKAALNPGKISFVLIIYF